MSSAAATASEPLPLPRWLHRWSVVTVCATVALLALGAVVTTFRVGMADPIWPTYPWHLLFINWDEPSTGFLIEHSHRLAGYVVGVCVLALAAGLWFAQPRRALGWLGVAAVIVVSVQGLLGGFRVKLNALVGTDLAVIHGNFAQLVFSFLVCLAVLTSRGWSAASLPVAAAELTRVRRWSVLTAGLVYGQLLLGGFVRHNFYTAIGQRGHAVVAFLVVIAVAFLVRTVFESPAATRGMTTAVTLLAAFVVLQVLLGIEAWIMKFGAGGVPDMHPVTVQQAVVRTAHFLVGAAVFSSSVVVVLQTYKQAVAATIPVSTQLGHVEGAA